MGDGTGKNIDQEGLGVNLEQLNNESLTPLEKCLLAMMVLETAGVHILALSSPENRDWVNFVGINALGSWVAFVATYLERTRPNK